jgi:acetoacetyl-CoA reductase
MAKVAVVTGGTRGIGAAICKALKEQGHTVAATYQGNEEAAHKFMAETGIVCFKFDVADEASVEAGVKQIAETLGPIDILVNNAGITRDGFLHKMSAQSWHEVIATNLTSCFLLSRAVIGGMRERGWGRIINISSINGQKGQLGQTNYAAAKAGMIGFTKALALENANKGITVNAIAPGYIATDMVAAMDQAVLQKIVAQIPAGRLGKPEEVARTVAFLTGEDASWMTGSTLTLNGGQYLA